MKKTLTQEDIVTLIKIEAGGSSLTAVADRIGVSKAYMSDVVNGRRDVSEKIANAFGFTRKTQVTTVFVKKSGVDAKALAVVALLLFAGACVAQEPPLPIVNLIKHTPKADTYRVRCKVPYQVSVVEKTWMPTSHYLVDARLGNLIAVCWGPTKYNWSEIVTVPAREKR